MPSPSELAKDYWRSNHSQSPRVIPEGGEQDYRFHLAREILSLKPETVFEFGCASGRNLAVLFELNPLLDLTGLDMNPHSLAAGRGAHPDLEFILGDERALASFEDKTFDVVFTASVLDHVPTPEWQAIYDELCRIARQAVILYEPMSVEKDALESSVEDAPLFTWYHDYLTNDPELQIIKRLPMEASQYSCAADYYLMRRVVE